MQTSTTPSSTLRRVSCKCSFTFPSTLSPCPVRCASRRLACVQLAITHLPPAVSDSSFNGGQTCCAGSRIFVQKGIYDKFAAGFKKQTEALKVGDPFDENSYQGPMVSKTQCDRIMGYVESGKEQGAKVITGGKRHGDKGYFIEPVSYTTSPKG